MTAKDLYIVKANNLVEARYKLTLEEQRLILYFISKIQPYDEDFEEYTVNINDFTKLVNEKKANQYGQIKKIIKNLVEKSVTIKESENKILVATWLASAFYDNGIIKIAFAPRLKPYLLQLKNNFTSYKIENIMSLKSIYSIRMYELLKQYEKISYRVFSIMELRELLNVGKTYDYSKIKIKAFLVAQAELKEKTDIYFEFEEIKEGRRVAKVKFIISKNPNYKLISTRTQNMEELEADDTNLSKDLQSSYLDKLGALEWILRELCLPKKDHIAILEAAEGDLELINSKFEYAKLSKKDNMVGFLIWACKHKDTKLDTKKTGDSKKEKELSYIPRDWDKYDIEKLEQERLLKEAGDL